MFSAAAIAILVTMALALVRALLGPTTFDRILAANMIATKIILLIAVLGFLTERPEFMDIAVAYAVLNFIGTVAVLKLMAHGTLGAIEPPASRDQP